MIARMGLSFKWSQSFLRILIKVLNLEIKVTKGNGFGSNFN